jgi:hypothetical protein
MQRGDDTQKARTASSQQSAAQLEVLKNDHLRRLAACGLARAVQNER